MKFDEFGSKTTHVNIWDLRVGRAQGRNIDRCTTGIEILIKSFSI